jgi:hypothetical protein
MCTSDGLAKFRDDEFYYSSSSTNYQNGMSILNIYFSFDMTELVATCLIIRFSKETTLDPL